MTPNPNFEAAAGATDVDLVAAARPAVPGSFVELFDRHSETLFHYACSLTGDPRSAGEVVRKLFTLAWAKRRSMRFTEKSALPWLLAACRRQALDSARSRRRGVPSSPAAESELATVFVAVGELSAVEQQLCWLCVYEGKRYRAAAAQLSVTTFTARRRRRDWGGERPKSTDYREALS